MCSRPPHDVKLGGLRSAGNVYLHAIAFSLSEHLVTNDLEPSENTHFTENQAKHSGVLYFVFPQINEGVRNQENTDRLEWLQAHVNLESIGEVRFIGNILHNLLRLT